MILGCFQSNKGLRELEYRTFVKHVVELGYAAVDLPLTEADSAEFCRGLGLHIHSAGPLFLPEMSTDGTRQEQLAGQVIAAVDAAAAQNIPTITSLAGRAPNLNGDDNVALFRDQFTRFRMRHAEHFPARLPPLCRPFSAPLPNGKG